MKMSHKMEGKIKLYFSGTLARKVKIVTIFIRCFVLSHQSLYVGLFSKYDNKYCDEMKATFDKGTNNVLVFRTVSIINSIKTRLNKILMQTLFSKIFFLEPLLLSKKGK